ncbi:MAG: lipopolysaccharide heptosyltransferase family protein [Gammaproteobacteria bacterium]|nr:MAG: lipopolysaccharide heptosyltransferase family protein [Gammaproteobacteria bacterium]
MPFSRTQPPESLCLIRLSAIGDCCHTLPVVRTFQAHWPDTRISWIIGKTEHALFAGTDGIEFITYDKADPWGSLRRIRHQVSGRRFPLLLHMHPSMRANLVSLCVRADLRLGLGGRTNDYQWLFTNARTEPKDRVHVMDRFFGFAEYFGLGPRELRWDIPVSDADRALARSLCAGDAPVCVISPCSNPRFRNFRNWRAENYAALAAWLRDERGARIIVTGGPTETERRFGEIIAAAGGEAVTNLVGQTSLKQLFAIIGEADLVICPDSGPAHMATAAGTLCVGLYATTNRLRAAPYFCQDLVVDKYPDAVQREYGKPVEALRWGTRVRNPAAMDLITLSDVTAKIDQALARLGKS